MTGATLVTGGGNGIGAAVARRVAGRGDHVVVADLDGTAAEQVAAAIRQAGGSAVGTVLDVSDPDAVQAVVADIEADRPLTAAVNSAGIGMKAPLVDMAPSDLKRTFDINVLGTYFVMQACARGMVARGSGSIVNLASTSGFTASTVPMTAYDSSKGAVRMLTISAARELGPQGVRVNAIAPGTIDTNLTRTLADTPGSLDRMASSRIPLGRLGQPEEIADAAAWLTSPEAAYVTGHVLVVDGGWLT